MYRIKKIDDVADVPYHIEDRVWFWLSNNITWGVRLRMIPITEKTSELILEINNHIDNLLKSEFK